MLNMQDEYLLRIHYKNLFKDQIQSIYFKNTHEVLSKHDNYIYCKRKEIPSRQNILMVTFA